MLGFFAAAAGALAVDKFFGKGKPPAPPQMKEVPPFKDMTTIIDEIAHVMAKKNPDGSITISRRPKDKMSQEFSDGGLKLIQEGIQNMNYIYKNYPDAVPDILPAMTVLGEAMTAKKNELEHVMNMPDFKQFLDDFKTAQTSSINEHYSRIRGETMNDLAAKGYAGSAMAASYQNMMDSSKAKDLQQLDAEAPKYAMDLYSQNQNNVLNRAGAIYNMNDSIAQNPLTQNQLQNQQFLMQQQTQDKQFDKASYMSQQGINMAMYDKDLAMRADPFGKGLAASQAENAYNLQDTQLTNQAKNQSYQNSLMQYQMTPEHPLSQLVKGAMTAYAGGSKGASAFNALGSKISGLLG